MDEARPGNLEIWELGEQEHIKKRNSSKSKYIMPKMLARSRWVGKNNHLTLFRIISVNFSRNRNMQKLVCPPPCNLFVYFPLWVNRQPLLLSTLGVAISAIFSNHIFCISSVCGLAVRHAYPTAGQGTVLMSTCHGGSGGVARWDLQAREWHQLMTPNRVNSSHWSKAIKWQPLDHQGK